MRPAIDQGIVKPRRKGRQRNNHACVRTLPGDSDMTSSRKEEEEEEEEERKVAESQGGRTTGPKQSGG